MSAVGVLMLCALATHPRVALVGDSHMQGLDWPLRRALAARGYVHAGTVARQGWNLRRYQSADDLTAALRPMRPDVVLVVLGSNDYGVRSPRRYGPRARWLVDAARASGARRIVWLGPGSVADREDLARVAATHDRVADLQATVLPGLGVDWLDSRDITRGLHRADGHHLTRAGYATWARWAAGHLQRCPVTTDAR